MSPTHHSGDAKLSDPLSQLARISLLKLQPISELNNLLLPPAKYSSKLVTDDESPLGPCPANMQDSRAVRAATLTRACTLTRRLRACTRQATVPARDGTRQSREKELKKETSPTYWFDMPATSAQPRAHTARSGAGE